MLINIFDSNGVRFSPLTGTLNLYSYYEYVANQMEFDGITIFTDHYIFNPIVDQVKSKLKIAWLYEPRAIYHLSYDIYKVEDKFDYIFTHDQELLNRSDKYKFVPTGACWIPEDKRCIGKKTKLVSSIMSEKRSTAGHMLRHSVYSLFHNKIDFYGNFCKHIPTKDLALSDYMFSLCIENSSTENYFTEKIIDCFATGTIPIYWGCKNISKFFNIDGIFGFDNIMDLNNIINNLNEQLYLSKINAIKENFELAKEYFVVEDWVYKNIITKF